MQQDIQKYTDAAKNRKTDFIITLTVYAVIIAAAIVAVILLRENPVAVIAGTVALVWIIATLVRLLKKKPPRAIFATEIKGEITDKRTVTKSSGERTVTTTTLTVKCDNRETVILKKLPAELAGVYEVGDKILRIRSTEFPVILESEGKSPASKCSVCPLCGKARLATEPKCPSCKI